MLHQTPRTRTLLPLCTDGVADRIETTLFIPDEKTVLHAAALTCLGANAYATVLESAAGAQAATLMAMRTAYDNAAESKAELETAIGRRRQSDVTADVIETASENTQ